MKQVFLQALSQTFSSSRLKFLFGSSVTAVIGTLLIGHTLFGIDKIDSIKYGIIAVFAVFILMFLYFFVGYTLRYLVIRYKESIYGEALTMTSSAISRINHLKRLDSFNDEEFKRCLIYTCQQLKGHFDKKNKSTCSVSIKVAVDSEVTANTKVVNICRDHDSLHRDTEQYNLIPHYIFQNTCFNNILSNLLQSKKSELYYHNDNIPNAKDYQNTSKGSYKDGMLPYKSELVVPIIPLHSLETNTYNIIGFICVDCVDKNKLTDKYDVTVLQLISEGMYDLFEAWREINTEQTKQTVA